MESRGMSLPSHGAIERILKQAGLTKPTKRRGRYVAEPSAHLRVASAPNEVWAIDYKGQFPLGDKQYCYPSTITDWYSRYLLACEGMARISDEEARGIKSVREMAEGVAKLVAAKAAGTATP